MDRDRMKNEEEIGRPADEEIIGTGAEDEDEFDAEDEDLDDEDSEEDVE